MSIEKLRPTFTFTEDRLYDLQSIVPEVFSDGKINWDTLREVLGEYVEEEGEEHFGLSWPGKREARRVAALPSKGALLLQPGNGINEENTHNIFIEGENLEVLKLLLKSYAGQVKMIYLDPPYNTGNDFVYPDDYSEPLEAYLKRTGQMDESGQILTTNSRASGRYHSNWLNMMYPRLLLAKNLLSADGVVVVSIDDTEVQKLRLILDEIFGEENFITQLIWKSRQFPDSRAVTNVSVDHEYLLVYSRSDLFGFRGIGRDEGKFKNPDNDPRGDWMSRSILGLATKEQRPNLHYSFTDPKTGFSFSPPANTGWRYSIDRMKLLISENKILFPSSPTGRPREKKFRSEMTKEFISFPSIIDDVYTSHGTAEIRDLFGADVFDFPKPPELIRRIIEQCTNDENIILDFFAGSCSTAQAMIMQNMADEKKRTFILVQLPEPTKPGSEAHRAGFHTISDIGRERIRRVIDKMKSKNQGQITFNGNQDLGFKCYRLDRSAFKDWQPFNSSVIQDLQMRLDQAETPLVAGWQPHHLLTEILLLQGFPLDSQTHLLSEYKHNHIQMVTSDFCQHRLYICLDENISQETVDSISVRAEDIFVCLDSAMNDEDKIRLSDRCNLKVI